jgi:hypothetical protein
MNAGRHFPVEIDLCQREQGCATQRARGRSRRCRIPASTPSSLLKQGFNICHRIISVKAPPNYIPRISKFSFFKSSLLNPFTQAYQQQTLFSQLTRTKLHTVLIRLIGCFALTGIVWLRFFRYQSACNVTRITNARAAARVILTSYYRNKALRLG